MRKETKTNNGNKNVTTAVRVWSKPEKIKIELMIHHSKRATPKCSLIVHLKEECLRLNPFIHASWLASTSKVSMMVSILFQPMYLMCSL